MLHPRPNIPLPCQLNLINEVYILYDEAISDIVTQWVLHIRGYTSIVTLLFTDDSLYRAVQLSSILTATLYNQIKLCNNVLIK